MTVDTSHSHSPRTLVLCFDGTGNAFADETTNVVRFFSALEKKKRDKQLCYYQPGIGTYVSPTVLWANTFRNIAKFADEAFAWYLGGHIMSGYRFLMENYKEGDKICLFGFSRGAYTARCLAGMLNKVGLLPKWNEEQIQFAWEQYKDVSPEGRKRADQFKRTFSTTVDIQFIGVWDTVSSVGLLGRHLSFSSSNSIVKTFRHALALDEHRTKFKPNPWHRTAPNASAAENDPEDGTPVVQEEQPRSRLLSAMGRPEPERRTTTFSVDTVLYNRDGEETDVKEVWFPGCHADVGGGSIANSTDPSLANASLSWMVSEAIESGAGIIFRKSAFKHIPGVFAVVSPQLSMQTPQTPIPVITTPDFVTSPQLLSTLDSQQETRFNFLHSEDPNPISHDGVGNGAASVQQVREQNASAPMYDQLVANPLWWILEFIPMWEYKQDSSGHWHKGFNWNRGRPRRIQTINPLFHRSVQLREEATSGKYRPRAVWDGMPEYTD